MKKKRKFKTGGEFELDADALASGLRMGKNERITDADREAGIAAVERAVNAAKGMSDAEATLLMKNDLLPADMQTPAGQAESIPVPRPRAIVGRSLPAPRAAAPNLGNQNDYSMNEMEGSGRGSEPAPRARAGATPRPVPAQNPTLPNVTPRVRNIPSSPEASPGMTARPSESMRLRREKERLRRERPLEHMPMKKGGAVKAKRGDGIAQRGKTKGRFV